MRTPEQLQGLDGLVIPGGESTTMTRLIASAGLEPGLRAHHEAGRPILGTCAGLIVCDAEHLGFIDVTARRNAFGRQLQSFEADLEVTGAGDEPLRAVFIRAPWVERTGEGVEVLAAWEGHPVAVRGDGVLASSFHPELTDDPRFHAIFMAMVTKAQDRDTTTEGGGERMSGDPRTQNLAKILVGYSTKVKEGEVVSIDGENAAAPLLLAVYEEVLKAGGNPVLNVALDGQIAAYFKHASDTQLEWISPFAEWMVDNADVRIAIGASTNTRELSGVPPERQTLRQSVTGDLMNRAMKRSAEGDFRWVYTLFPTSAYASEAEMSLADYEDFYYGACLADDGDPLTAWKRASEETKRLAEWIEGHEEVRITAPGTDIKLGIAGRKFIPCDGDHNMPDGEFFTGPIEDATEGEVSFHLPAVIGGREVSGVRLKFEAGRVVDASAERGEEFLIALLDTDEGARTLGELGIGTNYGIDRGTREVLLDEKIGGTIHMAVGQAYPESGGTNESAVHTDLVCDLRLGGKLEVDGVVMQENGKFIV